MLAAKTPIYGLEPTATEVAALATVCTCLLPLSSRHLLTRLPLTDRSVSRYRMDDIARFESWGALLRVDGVRTGHTPREDGRVVRERLQGRSFVEGRS